MGFLTKNLKVIPTFFLLLLTITCFSQQSGNVRKTQEEYEDIFNTVLNNNRYIEELDSASFYNLPIGILGGNNEDPSYSISIDQVVFYPDRAEFSASMVLTNPFNGEKLVFAADRISFSFAGGIIGTYRLELVNEKPVSVCKDIDLQILAGSYVECDCRGFRSMNLKGRLELSEKTFSLADLNGNRLPGKVSSFFETTVQNWNDLTFSGSFEPFQLKNYPDFTFQCENLAVDFSDLKNPENLRFPENYQTQYTSSTINLWRGLYIGEASIILSKKFNNEKSNQPFSIGVNDLLIDELGFSGKVMARNLFGINEGSVGGWRFSMNELMLNFNKNQLIGGSLAGLIHVPVFNENTNFFYSAKIDIAGNYAFLVKPQDSVSFNLFGNCKLDLFETSFISIASEKGEFIPSACFNGRLTINTSTDQDQKSNSKVSLANVEFQNLRVSTKEPFVDIEYLAYHGSEQGNLSKFPFTINELAFRNYSAGVSLSIVASVNLGKSSEEGFKGTAGLTFFADRVGYKYKYKGLQIDKIKVKVGKPNAFYIEGEIAFARGDEIYGNGFRGMLKATIKDDITLNALALFGCVNGNRYFFVDGLYAQSPGIQAGPIEILGFGGGIYHHMKQQTGIMDENSFGASLSGIVYKPDDNIALGIRATAKIGIIKDVLVNAQATFEIAFTKSCGISYIGFEGSALCITPPVSIDVEKFKKLTRKTADKDANKIMEGTPDNRGAISAYLVMTQDFEKKEFHAEMNVMVNVAGVLTGTGPGNRAGWAVIHASKKEWYIHIGSPYDPVGLSLLDMVTLKAYFMAGHHLPSTLPINPRVMQILNIDENKISGNRNTAALEDAKGIAFGASFELNTGDLSFAIFYASFQLGAGFDILMTNNGPQAYCKGHNPPLGINGWYAKGQAYAYLAGKIGLQAKVFGKSKKFEILSIAAAAYMRAEAPNPVWMIGYVGGEYRLLGGMIKGKCRFEVEVGEKCEMMAGRSAVADLQLISDVTPSDRSNDVDVFTTPQVVFNVPVETVQRITEDNGSQKSFRIKLVNLNLKQGEQTIAYTAKWNSTGDVVQVIPVAVLNPKTEYLVNAEIAFEEYVNNQWQPFKENNQVLTEKRTAKFTTGELPDKIPLNEVLSSYPLSRQYNFMPGEYNKAYFIFRRDLQVFFNPSQEYTRKARWIKNKQPEFSNISYSAAEKTLTIDLPSALALNTIYGLEVVAIPVNQNASADRNVVSTYRTQETGSDSISMEQKSNEAVGTITTTEEKIMLHVDFKTSKYHTLAQRMNVSQINVRALYDRGYMEFYLITGVPGNEAFDNYERIGAENISPLIQMQADLAATPWFTGDVYPKNYERYPWFNNRSIIWRDTLQYGLTASKAISIWQPARFTFLTDQEITTNTPAPAFSFCDFSYMLPYFWNQDYMDIRDGLSEDVKDKTVTDPVLLNILNDFKLRPVKPGHYPIKLNYVLPGKNIITSTKTIMLNSTIKTDAQDF